jgi:hypothetical protein
MFCNLFVESFYHNEWIINQKTNKKILTSDLHSTAMSDLSNEIDSGFVQNMLSIIKEKIKL